MPVTATRTPKAKQPKTILGQEALDSLSLAIGQLESLSKQSHSKDELVDLAAKLGAGLKQVESLQDSLKATIKTSLIQEGKTIAEGTNFMAVLTPIEKTILLTDKVKAFLGKKLDQFTMVRVEKHLTFKPKV